MPAASAAEAGLPERLGVLLGRLHQAVAHFPVALLLVAGVLELLGAVFASDRTRSAARVCLVFGAAAAVAAAVFGWLNADFDRSGPDSVVLSLHRWGGVALAVVAIVAVGLSLIARTRWLVGLSRLTTIGVAAMVVAVGHWGGTLVHGEGYLLAALAPPERKETVAAAMESSASPVAATAMSPEVEAILFGSSDEGVFRLRRAIRLASLPPEPRVPPSNGPSNNEIDRFIEAAWSAAKLPQASQPPVLCDDATFARRVYLDVIGVVPTIDELARFHADTHPDKRARLVDELLARDADYADHWTPFWEDALGSSYVNLQGGVPTRGNYRKWINESFRTNKAFDLFAAELIDTRLPGAKKPEIGDANGRKSKIAYIRNETHTDTLQSAAAVAQVFLGTSVKCASCHSHFENEEWPQRRALAYSSLFAAHDLELVVCEKHTGEVVPAAFCFEIPGVPREVPSDEDGRLRRAAQLVTDPHNPRFARAIVNRLWKRYMGLGLVEPADDFRADVPPSHPELLDWLARDLATHDFNLKRTIRLILTSRTYQLRYDPALEDHFDVANKSAPRYFRSPSLRRMTAEQVVDSIRVAADQKLEPRARLFHVNESTALSRVLGKPASRNEISTARADDAAVVQSLELLNGEEFGALVYSAAILSDAAHVSSEDAGRLSNQITRLYTAVLSRPPSTAELEAAREYVSSAAGRSSPDSRTGPEVLIEDDLPEYARAVGSWNWTDAPAPASGGRWRAQRAELGNRIQHYVLDLSPARVMPGDTLFVWVRIDPADPPRQIMVQWNDGVTINDGGWSHRAYWGEDLIPFGKTDSPSRRRVGDLPAWGEWVRLDVPAAVVGFTGAGGRIVGMSFDQHGGTVHWDAAGIVAGMGSAETEALGDLMWALLASPEFQYVR